MTDTKKDPTTKKDSTTKPRLERMYLLKQLLQGFRAVMDEELQPDGITSAQLRVLWMVDATSEASGAEISRLCGMTPQSGQAMLVELAKHGWISRKPSKASERVLVSELTASGRAVLGRAKTMAEGLDKKLWAGNSEREMREVDAVLRKALERLGRT